MAIHLALAIHTTRSKLTTPYGMITGGHTATITAANIVIIRTETLIQGSTATAGTIEDIGNLGIGHYIMYI